MSSRFERISSETEYDGSFFSVRREVFRHAVVNLADVLVLGLLRDFGLDDFYLELSSGKFTWQGQVSNWVTLAGTAADYGANTRSGGAGSDNLNGPVSRVVQATLDATACVAVKRRPLI
jgi:hypothetical protein